jgi:dUTP pyrophosphatase
MTGGQSAIDVKEMNLKLLRALDSNDDYTYEQFLEEYGNHDSGTINQLKMDIKFVNASNNENPQYATEGSAGFDLRANLESQMFIPSGKFAIVPTGLYFEIPNNMEIQIRPRSGLAAKHGVTVLNSPGTIDSDYRGEIKVILINHGEYGFYIENGDRIAQAVFAYATASNFINLTQVDSIDENTERGSGGFGSTGTK